MLHTGMLLLSHLTIPLPPASRVPRSMPPCQEPLSTQAPFVPLVKGVQKPLYQVQHVLWAAPLREGGTPFSDKEFHGLRGGWPLIAR